MGLVPVGPSLASYQPSTNRLIIVCTKRPYIKAPFVDCLHSMRVRQIVHQAQSIFVSHRMMLHLVADVVLQHFVPRAADAGDGIVTLPKLRD